VISFVGAGPGAPDLITLRGRDRLAAADVVVWASSLVPEAVLAHARPQAEIHDSAAMTLEDVLAVYAARPSPARIVRLHSGDPSLYGAIGEQIAWCVEEGRDFEIVPGVSSLAAAAAALGRELTAPGVSQSVILTRLSGRTASSVGPGESLTALAAHGATMAVFLSGARPVELEAELRAGGYGPDTPAAVVVRVSWPDQQVHETTVGELAATIASTGATRTLLVLVGDALAGPGPGVSPTSTAGRSRLYAPDFAHAFRRRSLPGSTAGRPK
jgi:precorrin-4/cobalt-precorrin-4 C11-methyltransferase